MRDTEYWTALHQSRLASVHPAGRILRRGGCRRRLFRSGPSGCTDNGGTILKDSAGNCFYRMNDRAATPVNWFGAKCDAVTTVSGGSITGGTSTFTSSSVQF